MSLGSFKNVIYKVYLNIIYLIYTYKKDLVLNKGQCLICHKTKPNQTKSDIFFIKVIPTFLKGNQYIFFKSFFFFFFNFHRKFSTGFKSAWPRNWFYMFFPKEKLECSLLYDNMYYRLENRLHHHQTNFLSM